MRNLLSVLALGFVTVSAQAVVLYDGANPATPQSQGHLAYRSLPIPATASTAGGKTSLDTSANFGIGAGFATWDYNPLTDTATQVNAAGLGSLDRNVGYTVRFDAKLLAESHSSADRAGLSLTAISQDLKGIEIGFWPDRVWAQADSPLFTKAEESSTFDTQAAITTYELTISGSAYALTANGTINLLNGNLRDYSSFGKPYNLANFIFVGDNTTSAQASFEFSHLSVAVVPEPGSLCGMILCGLILRRRR